MINQIKKLIAGGENQKVEFKEAFFKFPKDAFESICAFLNADGGSLLLGVKDDGTISGIAEDCIEKIKSEFITSVNNPSTISPPLLLDIKEFVINGKKILYAEIPKSPNVHQYKRETYKRVDKSDFNITYKYEEIKRLYLSKETSYSENKIFPYFDISQLRTDLIDRVKKLTAMNNPSIGWNNLSDEQFLKRNALYQKDYSTGNEGITLAGILLFGTDEQIASVAPAFKFELVKRVENTERWDDRLTLRTNLIECFDKAMKFISNNLPDPFYTQGSQRMNLRDNIFREVVANMIVHKEYMGSEPTMFIINKNEIIAKNSSTPYIRGFITPQNVTNHPKNPNIIKIFRGIGYVEELGSGISKIYQLCKKYSGHNPEIKDDDIFEFKLQHDFFPLVYTTEKQLFSDLSNTNQVSEQASEQVTAQVSEQVSEQASEQVTAQVSEQASEQATNQVTLEKMILEYCTLERSYSDILNQFGYKSKGYFRKKYLNPLIQAGKLNLTAPDSPRSPMQKYYTVVQDDEN